MTQTAYNPIYPLAIVAAGAIKMNALNEKTEQIRAWFRAASESVANGETSYYKGLEKAVIIIFERQTADEQVTSQTRHENGRGFTGSDAEFGSAMAKRALAIRDGSSAYATLTIGMYRAIARMMPKYSKQLAENALNCQTV